MIPGDVYTQNPEPCVHKPDHSRHSPVAYLKIPFIQVIVNFTGGELVSGQEEIEHNLAYPVFIPAEILNQSRSYPFFRSLQFRTPQLMIELYRFSIILLTILLLIKICDLRVEALRNEYPISLSFIYFRIAFLNYLYKV